MRAIEILTETAKTLYHGTLVEYVPAIKDVGLQPNAGDFTKQFYQEYEEEGIELPELVFASDKAGLNKCLSAIIGAMRLKAIPVTMKEFKAHGALVVIRQGADHFEKHTGDENHYDYQTVEPNDYYRENGIDIDHVLTGDAMLRVFKRHGVVPMETTGQRVNGKRSALIRYYLKQEPVAPPLLTVSPERRQEIIDWIMGIDSQRMNMLYDRMVSA
jgi:hypothetical protein